MRIPITAREIVWFYGFKIFYNFKHPVFFPLKILRKTTFLFRGVKGNKINAPTGNISPKIIPKKIWIYWTQGWDNAPPLVKMCRDSWAINNPDWEIHLLDQDDFFKYVTLDYSLKGKQLTPTNYSNILRLQILSKHGGVWTDATTFCNVSLDELVPSIIHNGFFTYCKPKTTVADWFMVAEENNIIVRRWGEYVNLYWKFANKEGPYFWPHYLFEYLICLNVEVRNIWNSTPHLNSDGPYIAQRYFKQGKEYSDEEFVKILFDQKSPMYKLDRRMEISSSVIENVGTRLDELKKEV